MKMMKIVTFCKTVFLLGLVLFFSCSQDPIFNTISEEPAPEKPRIPGSPTKIVIFELKGVPVMYVAAGSLHWYAKTGGNSGWDSAEYDIPQPDGKIIDLAATSSYLYALCNIGTGIDTVLRRISNTGDRWVDIPVIDDIVYTSIQAIYADPSTDRLFAGIMHNGDNDFGIFYLDNAALTLRLLQGGTALLSGAASHNNFHYLSTKGKGVYKAGESGLAANNAAPEQLVNRGTGGNDRLFMVYKVESGGVTYINSATGKYATGALALWDDGGTKMFTAGIQGGLYDSSTTSSSFTHGYVEFYLDSSGIPTGSPNEPSVTVNGYTDRYQASLGKHPINHLYQASERRELNWMSFSLPKPRL